MVEKLFAELLKSKTIGSEHIEVDNNKNALKLEYSRKESIEFLMVNNTWRDIKNELNGILNFVTITLGKI